MSPSYNVLQPIGTIITGAVTLEDYLEKMFFLLIGVCGVLAVVMLVICGIKLMMSEGAGGREEAKKCIWAAIFGLLIAISAWLLLNTINPQLVGSTMSMDTVTIDTTATEAEGTSAGTAVSEPAPRNPGWYIHYQEGTSLKYKKFKPNEGALCSQILVEMQAQGITILAGGPENTVGCFEVFLHAGGATSADETSARASLCGEALVNGCLTTAGVQIDKRMCENPGIYEPGCTSVGGLPQSSLNFIKTLPGFCGGCTVIVTGGAEKEAVNHGVGLDFFDLRLSVGDALYNAITGSGASQVSFNGNRRWLVNGFWFTDDQTSGVRNWHVCKDGANTAECMACGAGNTLCPPAPPPLTGGGGGGGTGGGGAVSCGTTPSGTAVKSLDWVNDFTGNTEIDNPRTGIIAYKFTVRTSRIGQFSTVFTGGEKAARVVSVTECPGDILNPLEVRCLGEGFEFAGFSYSAHPAGANDPLYCNLEVGKTYYVNVKNATLSSIGSNTCATGTNCPFYRAFR